MKNLSIYCIVDVVSETILNVFSAISLEMAKRQFDQAIESNRDKIYDIDDIVLMVPYHLKPVNDDPLCGDFNYYVPETYSDVKYYFVSYNEYIGNCGKPISKTKEV